MRKLNHHILAIAGSLDIAGMRLDIIGVQRDDLAVFVLLT
jgi:hypothetical protein